MVPADAARPLSEYLALRQGTKLFLKLVLRLLNTGVIFDAGLSLITLYKMRL